MYPLSSNVTEGKSSLILGSTPDPIANITKSTLNENSEFNISFILEGEKSPFLII